MIQNLKRLIQESCIASRDFATYSVFKALNDLIYQDFNFLSESAEPCQRPWFFDQ